jgi:hypothetical protein
MAGYKNEATPGYKSCRFCSGRGCLACKGEQSRDLFSTLEPIDERGKTANCPRCARAMQVARARRKDGEILRLSKTTKGVCCDCAVTEFLYNTYPANTIIDESGPELLLKPGIREAFLQSGLMDRADLNIDEVNWQNIVTNWHLPVKAKRTAVNPYTMGGSPRSHLKRAASCKCPASDSWRCARQKHMDGVIACPCECHKTMQELQADSAERFEQGLAEVFGGEWDVSGSTARRKPN